MLAEGHLSAVIFSLVFTILAAVIYWKISGWAVKIYVQSVGNFAL